MASDGEKSPSEKAWRHGDSSALNPEASLGDADPDTLQEPPTHLVTCCCYFSKAVLSHFLFLFRASIDLLRELVKADIKCNA